MRNCATMSCDQSRAQVRQRLFVVLGSDNSYKEAICPKCHILSRLMR
jgi:hypothetical protein